MIITSNMKEIKSETEIEYYERYKSLVNDIKSIYIRCTFCNYNIDITAIIKDNVEEIESLLFLYCNICGHRILINFIHFDSNKLLLRGKEVKTLKLEDYFDQNNLSYKY